MAGEASARAGRDARGARLARGLDRAGRRTARVEPAGGPGPRRAAGGARARRPRLLRGADAGGARPRRPRRSAWNARSPKRAPSSLAREEADRLASEAGAACAALERDLEETRDPRPERRRRARRGAQRPPRGGPRRRADRGVALAPGGDRSPKSREELVGREREANEAEREAARLQAAAAEATARVTAIDEELARLSARLTDAEAARDEAARGGRRRSSTASRPFSRRSRAREMSVNEVRQALRGAGLSEHGALSDRIRPARRLGRRRRPRARKRFGRPARLGRRAARRRRDAATVRPPAWSGPTGVTRRGRTGRRGRSGGTPCSTGTPSCRRPSAPRFPARRSSRASTTRWRLSETHPGMTFVTRRREVVRGPVVRVAGPAAEATGLFALRREGETLTRRLQEAREALAAAERRLEELRGRRLAREAERPALREAEREAQGAWQRLRGPCSRSGSASATAFGASTRRSPRSAPPSAKRPPGSRPVGAPSRTKSGGWRRPRTTRTSGSASLSSSLSEARANAPVARRRARPPPHRGRGRGRAPPLAWRPRATRCARRTRRSSAGSPRPPKRKPGSRPRAAELTHEEAEARARQTANLAARETQAVAHAASVETAREIASRVESAEAATRTDRAALDAAREARFEAEVTATRAASDLEHLVAQCREEFGVEPDEPRGARRRLARGPRRPRDRSRGARRLDRAAGAGQRARLRGAQGDVRAPRLPDDPARRSPEVDRRAPGVDPQDQRDLVRAVRRGVPRDQRELQGDVRPPLPGRRRPR